ncbi:beta-lactamase-like protein [Fusarium avenaceum]|nr:beta-lactamase-like protein [Fusarium avenaceum]
MTSSVEIASVPTVDTPGTCLFVHAEKRSYVFGRPEEGTQRAFQSRKLGMGATEQVFLTGSVSWQQIGGLFGYVLTVGGALEASKEQAAMLNEERKSRGKQPAKPASFDTIHVHGGENLCHTLAACRPVILRQPIKLRTHEHREDPRLEGVESLEPDWQDDVLRFKEWSLLSNPEVSAALIEEVMFNGSIRGNGFVYAAKLRDVGPTETVFTRFQDGDVEVYKGPRPGDTPEPTNLDQTVWKFSKQGARIDRESESINLVHRPLPPTIYSKSSMCYIVKCFDRRGKFNAKRAKELGVEVTDFKRLTGGETVETKDGVVVTPDMVLGETQPGQGFIVADLESRDYIDSFMERPEWSNPELMDQVNVMYWILGPKMADDARIQKFVEDHPTLKHIFCAKDTCPNMISLAGPGQLQAKLRRIDPDRFSLLNYDNTVHGSLPSGPLVESGRVGNKVALMPRFRFDAGTVVPFPDLAEAAQSVSDEILELAKKAHEETTDPEFLRKLEEEESDIPNRDAEIIPLGTGSSIPGKYRNVSATLIRVPGIGNYIFDVGEGTLGQIRRLFGDEETGNILRDLKCIVISHLHADHHLGAPNLIKAWYNHNIENSKARLAISCVSRYKALLEEVSQVDDIGFHRLKFPNCTFVNDRLNTGRFELDENDFGLKSITRIPVPHCWMAFATELELTSGLRMAYSGDCRPSDDFALACEGAHLLIHECTFDDDMLAHAKKKMHSTMSEALEVARKMKARKTLLTHFSQRYVKSDSLKREDAGRPGEVLMAFDHMNVKLGDFRKAAAFQPAIAQLLADASDK